MARAVPAKARLRDRRSTGGTNAEPLSAGFVGTYPPTACGIATFNHALRRAMGLADSGVVACVDEAGAVPFGAEVVAELVRGSPASIAGAAAALDRFDIAIVQHEFGIYGGEDGGEIVELVAALERPAVVVMHTALREPSPGQRAIVEQLAALAALVIVQSEAARACLVGTTDIDPRAVHVVPHGATVNLHEAPRRDPRRRPVVLTWGLLSPVKGIELGIAAVSRLRDVDPLPRYVVHGRTHPRILEREGEAYRLSLQEHAEALAVRELVEFDNRYVDTSAVLAWIREADVVLLPYRSRDQVVSGVLVEAIASGKPVVATGFPHALELLGEGSGIVVPHDDPEAIATALRRLLTDHELRLRMAGVARRQAPTVAWASVGRRYRQLAALAARSPREVPR